MIKKFNEFVNETHLQTQQNEWTSQKHNQLKYILTEMFGADVCRALMYKIDTNIYSFEEIINILRRFKEVNCSPNQMCGYLKMLLDEDIKIKEKREILSEIDSKTLPVEIDDYTGKILTGIVWYCEQLEKYAENEDDFNDEGFEYLANQAYEEGYTDDDGVEYAENNWDALEIYEVDLDKEFNWTDNGRWSELFDEFVNESFVNESRVIDSQNVKYSIHALLLSPISFLDNEGEEMIRQIRKEFKSNNFEKALSLIAELKVYLLNNDSVEKNYKYKKFMNKIDSILDETHFNEAVPTNDDDDYDNFVYIGDDDEAVPNRHINTKLDTRAVGRSKFDFIKGIVKEYFEEIIRKNGYISNLSKDELENVYKSEIKKIRRFLGENYYLDFEHFKALEHRLSSSWIDHGYCYSLEEIKDICDAIKQSNRKSIDNDKFVVQMLKHLLDSKASVSYKSSLIRQEKLNNIAVSICGKVLAGKVYYNAILGIFTKTEEEMEFLIDTFKKSSVYEVVTDYFDNIPDIDVYKIVDLS